MAVQSTLGEYRVHTRLDGLASSLVVMLCLVWGLNYVSMKIVNQGFQPVFQSAMRFGLAAIIVFGWCVVRRIRLFRPDGTLLPGIAAGLLFGFEFALITLALDYTSASRSVVFVYTMPFFVALGAHFLVPGERMTVLGFIGLAMAFCGVAFVFSDKLSLPSEDAIIGDVMCIAAAVLWAATTILIKTTRLKSAKPEKVLLYQLVVASLILFAAAPLFGPYLRTVTPFVVGTFAFQVIVVVAFTFLVWFWLIRNYPASRLTSFTFLTPVFGVLFGGLMLGEPVSWRLGLALVLVAIGIYLVNRPQRSHKPIS
jgi:drug/metabolite transporter (DMT)-like permease